ncbi:MAG: Mov34/MPN/PAD-1 family protein [Pirellulaceae bacterium]|jgi:proteasome lid subunit RPN8/RPN11|nr:Mov34/MPN/PAD-1 family protein [Pirellulaceae bacterium]MDP7016575.1 Mov34/MPN/PAD-1 family protein [Pirellulaceae bacterium]
MAVEATPKPIPCRDDAKHRKLIGSVHPDVVPIVIHERVLEEIIDYSEEDMAREIGGFLIGGYHVDGTREYVEIRHFLPAVDARSQPASLTFTHDSWAHFHRQADQEYPGEMMVGWHHTHPNIGVFLSGFDQFIHRHFFSLPWQIALVVDPARCELEFFQWRDGDIVDCGFVCIYDECPDRQEAG